MNPLPTYGFVWKCRVPHLPNGFADHYPVFKWLFHWEYTQFSEIPILIMNSFIFNDEWVKLVINGD